MKTLTPELRAEYAKGSTTIARCWKAMRLDGFTLCVTTCPRDLLFEGFLYRAANGFNPKAISQEASAAVANTEVDGTLSDDITETDFQAGIWDGCEVEVFEVNYRALSMGKMMLGTATMGNITVGLQSFTAELRGLTQSLQKIVGELWTKGCPAGFGDARCKVDLGPLTVTGTLTSAPNRRTLIDTSRTEDDDYFGAGVITITSGECEGEQMEIYSYDGTTKTFVLHLPLEFNVAAGDTYSVVPGCRKRYEEDCVIKWANWPNFRGAPHVPGANKMLGLGGTEGTNL